MLLFYAKSCPDIREKDVAVGRVSKFDFLQSRHGMHGPHMIRSDPQLAPKWLTEFFHTSVSGEDGWISAMEPFSFATSEALELPVSIRMSVPAPSTYHHQRY
jgi:hypothetical protein